MKLLLLLVVLIAAFAANCRDVPDGHPIQAFTFEQQDLPPVDVDHDVTEGNQYIVNRFENEKGQSGTELRGKKDKKTLKLLVEKIESLDYKLTQANLKLNKELQSIRENQENITESDKKLKMDLEIIKEHQHNITDINSDLKMELQDIGNHQVNITDTNQDLKVELKSVMKNITDGNSELQSLKKYIISSNSQLKTDVSSMKQSMTNGSSIIISILNSISASQGCRGTDVFLVRNQCFQVIRDKKRTWQDAQSMCSSLSFILAEPTDNNAALLRKYMVEKYGNYECWLGARGDGTKFVWQSSGTTLLEDSPLWDDNRGSKYMSSNYCLELDVLTDEYKADPGKPYDGGIACTSARWALCEVL